MSDTPITASTSFTAPVNYHVQSPSGGHPGSLLVALHGMGMSGETFLRVLRHMPESDGRWVLSPDGPYPFEKRSGGAIQIGYGWYIYRGDQDEFREHLLRSEEFLLRLVDEVRAAHGLQGVPATLLGFSQGGYLAGFAALRNPERFPGLVITSSRLKHEFLQAELAAGQLPKTLFVHSAGDESLPIERAREGMALLQEAGGDVELFEHDAGHRLPPEAVVAIGEWQRKRGLA